MTKEILIRLTVPDGVSVSVAEAPRDVAVSPGTPPTCPKHNKELRNNSRGWYCPTKDDSTKSGWCDYKP